MKNLSIVSLSAVLATAFLVLGVVAVQYSELLYSAVPCVFLLLIAVGDYGPKSRNRSTALGIAMYGAAHSNQRLRLAA